MLVSEAPRPISDARQNSTVSLPHIVVGITHPQTCLTLTGRLRALREAGFHITLISSPGDLLDSTAAREGAEPVAIPMRRDIAPLADLIAFWRLFRLLRRLRPDITEFSSPKAGLLGTVAAMFARVPVRIYMLRGLKLDTAKGLKRSILLAAERIAAASAHVVLTNSESLRYESLALRIAPEAKLKLIGSGSSNGVNIIRFSPGTSDIRSRLDIPLDAPVIGFVGRLTRDKGIPELLDAFDIVLHSLPGSHLLLVGWFDAAEDALSPDQRARIESHPHIHFTGYVPDTVPYYRAMDLLVLPTWREGFPNVVLEAAATAIPAVTTLSTGSRDAVVPEVTGLLIPPGSPEAIAEAALSLLNDAERRREMGRAARAWVVKNYADTHVLALIVDYYKSLLPGRGRP